MPDDGQSRLTKLIRWPGYAAFLTVLIIFTGLWGSLYASEIRSVFPFAWPVAGGSLSVPSLTFWFLVFVCGVMLFVRQRADDRARRGAEDRLIQRTRTLERLIRTQPPKDFLEVSAYLFDGAHDACAIAVDQKHAPEIVEAAARHILRAIAILAERFDRGVNKGRYASNVMWYRNSDSLAAEKCAELKARMVFCDQATDIKHLRGVLELDTVLSTIATDQTVSPDSGVKPIVLPVPKKAMTNGKHHVLPGAPHAWVYQEPDFFNDAAQLRRWCDENGDFQEAVKDELQRYFEGEETAISSFLSVPLWRVGSLAVPEDHRDGPAFAILNVHCDRPGLLRADAEPAKEFILVIAPFQKLLCKTLVLIEEGRSNHPPPKRVQPPAPNRRDRKKRRRK